MWWEQANGLRRYSKRILHTFLCQSQNSVMWREATTKKELRSPIHSFGARSSINASSFVYWNWEQFLHSHQALNGFSTIKNLNESDWWNHQGAEKWNKRKRIKFKRFVSRNNKKKNKQQPCKCWLWRMAMRLYMWEMKYHFEYKKRNKKQFGLNQEFLMVNVFR